MVHVAAGVGGEADGNLDDLVGIDADRVLEPALVLVDRVVELVVWVPVERDRGGEAATRVIALATSSSSGGEESALDDERHEQVAVAVFVK